MKTIGRAMSAAAVLWLTACAAASTGTQTGTGNSKGTPTDLAATPSTTVTSVSLTWTEPLPGATYRVYRGTASGQESSTPIGTATTTAYTDTDPTLVGATTYYYDVTAVVGGTESNPSNQTSATTADPGTLGVTIQ